MKDLTLRFMYISWVMFPVPLLIAAWLLLFTSQAFSQNLSSLSQWNDHVEALDRKNDTAGLAKAFSEGNHWLINEKVPSEDREMLKFRMLETRYLINYSKIVIDSGIQRYNRIQEIAGAEGYNDMEALALGRIANAYRSKRQMGEAFEFNQKEILAANKSGDSLLVGRALITELDILFNSLPWPVQNEDLDDLIEKGKEAIAYTEEHKLKGILPFGKLYVSKFYIKQGDFRRADSILASISDSEPLPVAFSKYEHLCEIAKQTGDLDRYREHTLRFKPLAYATKRPFVALNVHNYLLDYSMEAKAQDSAAYYARQLELNLKEVDTTKYLDFLDISYTTLARYYKDKNVNKELQYLSYSAEINRIIAARQRIAFMAIQKYKEQLADLEEENTSLSDLNRFFKNNMFTLLLISVLLLTVVFLLYRKYYRTRTQVAQVSEEKEQIAERVMKKSIELNNKQRVYLDQLKFIKADKNYVEFHTDEKRYVDRNKLSKVVAELPPNFVQVHRSYVINRNFIKTSDSRRVVLLPEIEIPISRIYKRRLNGSL